MSAGGEVTPAHAAALCGIAERDFRKAMPQSWPKLAYRVLAGRERDEVLLSILRRMDKGARVVGANDNTVWERGWGEIRDRIRSLGFHPDRLRPQYFDHHRILRLEGDWIAAEDISFVYHFDNILRRAMFQRWLGDARRIVELGCGTGNSQLMLAEMFPEVELVGSDWATPSQDLVRLISQHLGRPIRATRFNMLDLSGWDDLAIDRQTTVLTVHALEQLGSSHGRLLDRLIAARPRLCVHMEPIAEFYDSTTLFDYLALRYHRHRNYLDGWLTALRGRAVSGEIELVEERRLHFGDRYHEAYSVVVWRPR